MVKLRGGPWFKTSKKTVLYAVGGYVRSPFLHRWVRRSHPYLVPTPHFKNQQLTSAETEQVLTLHTLKVFKILVLGFLILETFTQKQKQKTMNKQKLLKGFDILLSVFFTSTFSGCIIQDHKRWYMKNKMAKENIHTIQELFIASANKI